MPLLTIHTNVHFEGVDTEGLLSQASASLARETGKSEDWIMIRLEFKSHLIFAGVNDPAAYVEIIALDLPDTAPARLTAWICDFLQEKLKIKPERTYVAFPQFPRSHFGWNRQTLD